MRLSHQRSEQRILRGEIVKIQLIQTICKTLKEDGRSKFANDENNPRPEGGWKVLRQRTDKQANGPRVAENILKTIKDPVEEDELRDLLEDTTEREFVMKQENQRKRKRQETSEDEDDY